MSAVRFSLRPGDGAPLAADPVNAEGYVTEVRVPTLTWWPAPATKRNGTGVIVCPGGGYEMLAVEHEGAAIARWLNDLGVTAFVLRYRVPRPGHPAPLQDAQDAIRLVRNRAAEFCIDPDRVGVLGASAGGHLAACAGTLFDGDVARPNFLVLLYPVIALDGPDAHIGSRRALLGAEPAPALLEALDPARHVTPRTPPAFLVHAMDDTVVPPANSVRFHAALTAAGVPAELRLCREGFHGFGLGEDKGAAADWPQACARWMQSRGWLSSFSPSNHG